MFSRFAHLAQPVRRAANFHTTAIARNEERNVTELFANMLKTSGPKDTRAPATANPLSFSFGQKNVGGSASRFSGNMGGPRGSGNQKANSGLTNLFPLFPSKVKTTSNPVHFEISQPSVGRSIQVTTSSTGVSTPMAVDNAYRRLNTVVKQSNMKRELRLRRTYEDGHTRMRREHQERNRKLFGKMVRKKIDLIKLMKARGM
ncbi:hypothetical protein DFQ27_003705 [Actinomortierella ambigua]|uniref:Ribosomal protein S21 n=1 Tax=Actinomortierella ambigua TaxID=1343610 RepID=A0A9P6UCF4_9FUNG|nr:hypothetical protein DFQ27_003705 [Actinomortierella ambigua]